jgi:hypothetical protein
LFSFRTSIVSWRRRFLSFLPSLHSEFLPSFVQVSSSLLSLSIVFNTTLSFSLPSFSSHLDILSLLSFSLPYSPFWNLTLFTVLDSVRPACSALVLPPLVEALVLRITSFNIGSFYRDAQPQPGEKETNQWPTRGDRRYRACKTKEESSWQTEGCLKPKRYKKEQGEVGKEMLVLMEDCHRMGADSEDKG